MGSSTEHAGCVTHKRTTHRNDLAAHTDRLVTSVAEKITANWNSFTVILVRPASVVSASHECVQARKITQSDTDNI
jgi:hypothetical protein